MASTHPPFSKFSTSFADLPSMLSPSLKCSIVFVSSWARFLVFISLFTFSVIHSGQPERQCPLFGMFFFFFILLSLALVVWPRLDEPFVSQNPREFCASHFLGLIQYCAYTSCSYDKILTSCKIPVCNIMAEEFCFIYLAFRFL